MSVQDLSDEEFARRGNAIFEEQVLPQIDDPEAKARHFVVIDIETGDYEVSDTPRTATDASQRLLDRRPEAMGRLWFRRVGSPTAHRVGGRFRPADRDGNVHAHGVRGSSAIIRGTRGNWFAATKADRDQRIGNCVSSTAVCGRPSAVVPK